MNGVSVVIPTIGRPSLETAVASIKAQEYSGSVEILVEPSTGNLGCPAASAARNRAVARAQYEWLAFLDDDDYWLPRHLSLSSSLMDADIILSNDMPLRGDLTVCMKGFLLGGGSFPGSAMLIKTGVFESLGGFNESLEHSEIFELLVRALASGHKLVNNPSQTWHRGWSAGYHAGQQLPGEQVKADRLTWAKQLL